MSKEYIKNEIIDILDSIPIVYETSPHRLEIELSTIKRKLFQVLVDIDNISEVINEN